MKKPASTPRKVSAQDAILDAAESLFGQFGPEGVSLRQIGAAAGSSNNSAVQYHFENKEGLLKGIFTRRLDSLEKRRSELLEQATAQGRATDTRTLLETLLLPIADEKDSSDCCSYAAFLLGLRMFGDIASWSLSSGPAPVTRALDARLRDSLPDLPDDVFRTRLLAGVSVFLMSVVDWDRQTAKGGEQRFASRDEFLKQVMDFVVAGMVAPTRI